MSCPSALKKWRISCHLPREDTGRRPVVFLDEAGLPKENVESLKAIHYWIDDGPLSRKSGEFCGVDSRSWYLRTSIGWKQPDTVGVRVLHVGRWGLVCDLCDLFESGMTCKGPLLVDQIPHQRVVQVKPRENYGSLINTYSTMHH